jgi:hypothetical protein
MPVLSPQVWPVSTGTITTALSTSFVAPIGINILSNPAVAVPGTPIPTSGKFGVKVSAIYIHVHGIAGGCSKLTLRVSPDATGDEILVPDTQATIATGYTTPTRGGVVYKVDVDAWLESPTLYVTVKTDAGTANLKYVNLTIEKN